MANFSIEESDTIIILMQLKLMITNGWFQFGSIAIVLDLGLNWIIDPWFTDKSVVCQAAPKAAAERPVPRHTRNYTNQWTDVRCDRCNVPIAGQIKFDEAPGQRDKPTWFMRVREADNSLSHSSGKYFSRRLAERVGHTDEFAMEWIRKFKRCCGSERNPPWKICFAPVVTAGGNGFQLEQFSVETLKLVLLLFTLDFYLALLCCFNNNHCPIAASLLTTVSCQCLPWCHGLT